MYSLLKGNALLTKGLILRLVLGALGGLPLTSLALFTAFERTSFALFDLWSTHSKKNETSLLKQGLLGLFFKLLSDILLIAIFASHTQSELLIPVFISLCGALFGIGQALTQGNIEDFYRHFIVSYLQTLKQKSHIQHQQKGFPYWAWSSLTNLLSIALIFLATYLCYYFYHIEALLVITALQSIVLMIKLSFDSKKYAQFFKTVPPPPIMESPKLQINTELILLTLINSLAMFLLMSSCYFMFITLSLNETIKTQLNVWVVMFMFVLGYEFFGTLMARYLSPHMGKHYKQYLFSAATIVLITSLAYSRFHSRNFDFFPGPITYALFLIYPLLMSFGLKCMGSIALQQIHQQAQIKSKEMAYSSLPGHLLLIGYCYYLVRNDIGIPNLIDSLDLNLNFAFYIFAVISMYLFFQRTRENAPSTKQVIHRTNLKAELNSSK